MEQDSFWTLAFMGLAVVGILGFKIYVHMKANKSQDSEDDA